MNNITHSETAWNWENFFKLIGAIGIASWVIQEWIIPHNKIFLFVTIVCFVADVFYIIAHKLYPFNKFLIILIWAMYPVCIFFIADNPEIPIPKVWKLRQTIRENRIHFIAHHNPLIICEWYFYEYIKPVADNLWNNWVKIFGFPVDFIFDEKLEQNIFLVWVKSWGV